MVLDITSFQERGAELKKAIVKAVDDTQSVLIRPYPDEILMTKAQYAMLQTDEEMKHTYDDKDQLYWTPNAMMDVRIKK